MINFILSGYKQNKFYETMDVFLDCHPYITFFAGLIVIPVSMVAVLFLSTSIITLPIFWILGWS